MTDSTPGDEGDAARRLPDDPRLERLAAMRVRPSSRILSRWVPAVVAVALVGYVVWAFITAPAMKWPVVAEFLFSPRILEGVLTTVAFTVITFIVGLLLGIVLTVMRQSGNPVLSAFCSGYIWIFRGTPLLVQLVFWFNLALIFPYLGFEIPGTGIAIGGNTNEVVSPFTAALVGLVLHTAAYMAEVVRGGFLAVPAGQFDAARAIGMTTLQAQRRIVIPQAVRVILPPLGNQFIDILKATSIVSVIGGGDLMTRAQQIYGQNYQVIALLIVASIWYLVLVTIASIGQHYLEKSLDGSRRPQRARVSRKELAR